MTKHETKNQKLKTDRMPLEGVSLPHSNTKTSAMEAKRKRRQNSYHIPNPHSSNSSAGTSGRRLWNGQPNPNYRIRITLRVPRDSNSIADNLPLLASEKTLEEVHGKLEEMNELWVDSMTSSQQNGKVIKGFEISGDTAICKTLRSRVGNIDHAFMRMHGPTIALPFNQTAKE